MQCGHQTIGLPGPLRRTGLCTAGVRQSRISRAPQRQLVLTKASSTRDEMVRQLQEKERFLASLFQSGRPMPRAAEVAGLRSEIDNLKAQLENRPQQISVPPSAAGPPSGAPPRGPPSSGPPSSGPPKFGPSGSRVRSRTDALAEAAFSAVEQQLRSNQGMGRSDDMEIARLEAENSMLRAEANRLLLRQQQLEQLLAEARGDKAPELLLDATHDLLARMKEKLKRQQAAGV